MCAAAFCGVASQPACAQEIPGAPTPKTEKTLSAGPATVACNGSAQSQAEEQPGSITGTLTDKTGNAVPGAHVTLAPEKQTATQEALADDDGQFSFTNVPPGPFHLTVKSDGFAPLTAAGDLASGESCVMPQMTLAVATNVTEVRVELTTIEIAQEQLKEQEKQRVLGVIPNFYVSYVPNAAPLSPKQKFQLAWKSTIDPVSFGVTGVVAGVEQATGGFSGYGGGAAGYARRYGAAYGDLVTGTFIGGAILPSILKQDPRYFYKGTGSTRSRFLYAIANAVICKGDNGQWQPNYSGILGGMASAGISNLYYPEGNKSDVAMTFENLAIGLGETAAVNVLQEFVIKKFTSNAPKTEPTP
jgi:hypothetical protein